MKPKLGLIIIALLLSFAVNAQRKRALLVGISHYDTALTGYQWNNINGVEDVDLLTPALKKQGFSTSTLLDEQATFDNIVNQIILFTNQTICTDVMDTFNRMNYDRMRGVLLAIRDFKEELSENEGITEYFRECKKYLNHYAAVTTLEFLDSDEIRDLAFNYMMKLREERMSVNGGPKSRKKKNKK